MGTLLNGKEQKFFDSVAVEVLTLAGTDGTILWKFSAFPAGVDPELAVDCLYEEPIPIYYDDTGVKHYRGYKVLMHFEEPTSSNDATDNGLVIRNDSVFWFARKDLENKKVPIDEQGEHISVGDIVQFFSKGKTWYFEFTNVERSGFEHDSEVWTHYRAEGIRNISFKPEQKIVK